MMTLISAAWLEAQPEINQLKEYCHLLYASERGLFICLELL
jgi:hypothetical protein